MFLDPKNKALLVLDCCQNEKKDSKKFFFRDWKKIYCYKIIFENFSYGPFSAERYQAPCTEKLSKFRILGKLEIELGS